MCIFSADNSAKNNWKLYSKICSSFCENVARFVGGTFLAYYVVIVATSGGGVTNSLCRCTAPRSKAAAHALANWFVVQQLDYMMTSGIELFLDCGFYLACGLRRRCAELVTNVAYFHIVAIASCYLNTALHLVKIYCSVLNAYLLCCL